MIHRGGRAIGMSHFTRRSRVTQKSHVTQMRRAVWMTETCRPHSRHVMTMSCRHVVVSVIQRVLVSVIQWQRQRHVDIRPTQSVMYVPLQVNRFAESVLLIVHYRYLKSCSRDFYSPESDPPHKIMRYWIYYSIWLGFSFPPDRICQVEMICIGGVPLSKRHFGGAGP